MYKLLSNIAGFVNITNGFKMAKRLAALFERGLLTMVFFRLTANSSKNKNLNGYSFSEELYKTQVCNLFFLKAYLPQMSAQLLPREQVSQLASYVTQQPLSYPVHSMVSTKFIYKTSFQENK